MQLQLSLGSQFVWALVHPHAKEYVKISESEIGYQDVNLILTQANPGPVKIALEDYPTWAQAQIKTAVRSGQLINTGDTIDEVLEPVAVAKSTEVEEKPAPKGPKKK